MSVRNPAAALNAAALSTLPASMSVPRYDRAALRPSIVHIGVGGFHRSHLATYIDDLCTAGHTDWAILGSGVLPGDSKMATVLDTQDGLYTLITKGPQSTDVQIIGSVVDYIHASPDAEELIAAIADPGTQVVSLTVTEGGYPVDDVSGDFMSESPNAGPGSAFAVLADGIERRRSTDGPPLTVMSCDNIMSNGTVTRTALLGEAARIGEELVQWIGANVSFPNSMVDRITPATMPTDSVWLSSTYGVDDQWPVVAEPFRQWVIEDAFAGDRPPLEELDVIVTDDVEPYEFMKLRLLNAGHSCLAYLAALEEFVTVDVAMADDHIERFVSALLHQEAKPVLAEVAGIDVDAYIDKLLERFANPQIGDQIARLCLDGSAKFPKFLLPTVRAQLAAGGPVGLSALALAGWCMYLNGQTSRGQAIELANDPQLDAAVEFARQSLTDPTAFLDFSAVFDEGVASSARFATAFTNALFALRSDSVGAAIDATLQASN